MRLSDRMKGTITHFLLVMALDARDVLRVPGSKKRLLLTICRSWDKTV